MAGKLSVDHIALPIFDVAGSLSFYTDVLGLTLVDALSGDDWGGKPWLMMMFELDDGRQLVLCALRGLKRPEGGEIPAEVQHYAFTCASSDALASWRERLKAHHVSFHEEDHGSQRSLYFDDPNGIVLEVTTPRAGASRNPAASDVVRAWLRN
jgi:glyoxylase I family protein